MAREAKFFISIDGVDSTGVFTRFATSISVTDSSGETSDSASIEVADDDGMIAFPKKGAKVVIGLGWDAPAVIFEGTVDDVRSRGGRGEGRSMSISAKSADVVKGKLKQKAKRHKDDAKLGDVAQEWGKKAGLSEVKVHPDLASIERPYWSQNGESFMAWGKRTAEEEGATFKIMGDRAVFVPRSAGLSASGKPLAEVTAAWGDNLVSWEIGPDIGRPQHAKSRSEHFDEDAGKWDGEDEDSEYETDAEAVDVGTFSEKDKSRAKRRSKSRAKKTDRDRGDGTVAIDGDTNAQAEGTCKLVGARPGIDGTYRIESVTHSKTRGGGFTTSLSVRQPSAGAGKDSR